MLLIFICIKKESCELLGSEQTWNRNKIKSQSKSGFFFKKKKKRIGDCRGGSNELLERPEKDNCVATAIGQVAKAKIEELLQYMYCRSELQKNELWM